jgi:hypothetical protein
MTRRRTIRKVIEWSLALLGVTSSGLLRGASGLFEKGPSEGQRGHAEGAQVPMDEARDRMRRAKERDARDTERLYSTKPTRVTLGKQVYAVPANFISPKGQNEPSPIKPDKLALVFFLPDFSGYTKDNWHDPFDPARITVSELSASQYELSERERFDGLKRSLEDKPSILEYGLEAYYRRNRANKGLVWVGRRSDGSFFYFRTTSAPGEPGRPGRFPLCDVRYYDTSANLFIAYRYALDHIHMWRAIDDGIWGRIHEWRE